MSETTGRGLRSPLDVDDDDDLGPLAAKLPQPKKSTAPSKRTKRKEAPEPEPEPQELEESEDDADGEPEEETDNTNGEPDGTGENPPNGGVQVPQEVGTQVGTSQGTNMGRSDEESEEGNEEEPEEEVMDFSLTGMLTSIPDPEVDWRKTGWSALRYRKQAVKVAAKMGWKGYRSEQEIVNAALAAFLPKAIQDEARRLAQEGRL